MNPEFSNRYSSQDLNLFLTSLCLSPFSSQIRRKRKTDRDELKHEFFANVRGSDKNKSLLQKPSDGV